MFISWTCEIIIVIPQLKDYIVDRESVGRLLPPKIEACVEKSRASYPLSFLHSNEYVANRIALIGYLNSFNYNK